MAYFFSSASCFLAMSRLLGMLVVLLLQAECRMAVGNEVKDFFKDCPPSYCGGDGLEIRFPFRLETSSPSCGAPGLVLSCSGKNDTLLSLPQSGNHKVTTINYALSQITIKLGERWARCPLQNLSSTMFTTPVYSPKYNAFYTLLMSCSTKFMPKKDDSIAGPISCLSNKGDFVYVAPEYENMDAFPSDCVMASETLGLIPFRDFYFDGGGTFAGLVDDFVTKQELILSWSVPGISDGCVHCEAAGKLCGFSSAEGQVFCIRKKHHGLEYKLIIGISVGGLLIALALVALLLHIYRKSDKEKETHLKVERFLAAYRITKPTRYTFAEVKRITKQFKHKLGQGGFGSVYKGELPNEIPVAVKMLENSKGEGEEFINEVATIGRIHHVNVVRLLGFCSEGTRHALIYEFLPNESLEKYIFCRQAKITHVPLKWEKLLEIAVGIARGIEYLHQGCNQRILHFDIKPHNILLDYDFNPKISDFGLAKLCSRDQSLITMTAARGTMGYIAPEMYSRNFGTVSYKSDVYSFGMLILEMVGGKKNVDAGIGNENEVYFPEKAYEWIVHDQDLELDIEMNTREEEIVKKLVIIALWCIQWNPTDRPSMTRVVQMLTGDLQSLQVPPKPFISLSDQGDCTILNEV